jgi:carnitine 3-dehydrogenase
MKHFIGQFGPCLKWPWTKLMDVPELTDALVEKIAAQSGAQSGQRSIRELEQLRDDNLVGIMRALKISASGAGDTINQHEANLPSPEPCELPVTVSRQVPQNWTDYNGHMNEANYLQASSQATDRFMDLIGADAAYIASGNSYFTAETHIRYLAEVKAGEQISITTQVLSGEGKKMQLFHRMFGPDGDLVATCETLQLHMNLKTRGTSLPSEEVAARLNTYVDAHASMLTPEGAGRHVGQKP